MKTRLEELRELVELQSTNDAEGLRNYKFYLELAETCANCERLLSCVLWQDTFKEAKNRIYIKNNRICLRE